MSCHIQIASGECVVALHGSLASGRQWTPLVGALGDTYRGITPDLFGHGENVATVDGPTALVEEAHFVGAQFGRVNVPLHLVGHSYGGAVAFKIATAPSWSGRIRSLTLIEPVLPTLLLDDPVGQKWHDGFARLGDDVCEDIGSARPSQALDRFLEFWKGSAPEQPLSDKMRQRMIEKIGKLARNNFTCLLSEQNVVEAAASLSVPTLLMCGGLSPPLTQRIVARLASTITGSRVTHVPTAGHLLPVTHAGIVNADIVGHIARADGSSR